MNALLIGGNRFLGVELTLKLLARGHAVTLLNRGNLVDPFGARVKRLTADRGTDAFDAALRDTKWDVVFDFALFDGPQAERLVRVLDGRAGHVIAISTGQVYLVRTPRPEISVEADYDGPVLAAPPSPAEQEDWAYGIEKRAAEDVLAASRLPFTTFRLPMVHGGRDHKPRWPPLLWKLVERQEIRLRAPQAPVRHVFSGAVVDQLLAAAERGPLRRAFNLAWAEPLTCAEFVQHTARQLGVEARIVEEPTAGVDACFLNSRWMSALDASLAHRELGFTHPPLATWFPQVFHALTARL